MATNIHFSQIEGQIKEKDFSHSWHFDPRSYSVITRTKIHRQVSHERSGSLWIDHLSQFEAMFEMEKHIRQFKKDIDVYYSFPAI